MNRDDLRSQSGPALPVPDAAERDRSQRLSTLIARRIDAAGGWISFAEYMQQALYAPGLGYYAAGSAQFGEGGDFVTAPELSPLFAATVAAGLDPVLRALGGGRVLELGPGSGRFASAALAEFTAQGTPVEEYLLLEPGAALVARQQALLREGAPPATAPDAPIPRRWLDALPEAFDGVVIANEIVDALPCERFVMQQGVPWRLGVGHRRASVGAAAADDAAAARIDGAGIPLFEWRARPPDGACPGDEAFAAVMRQRLQALAATGVALPDGCCGEFHPALGDWVASLARCLRRGVLLFFDYGLPRAQLLRPERLHGTLRGFFRHRAHDDPFLWPGLSDLTAWVDFTALAEAGEAAGLEVAGFTTQAGFLLGGGIEARLAAAQDAAPDAAARAALAHGARRLLLPGEMGEAVKVMALARGCEVLPTAFALQDLRRAL
jgi:SAM-dependent MidA family methyltransferase